MKAEYLLRKLCVLVVLMMMEVGALTESNILADKATLGIVDACAYSYLLCQSGSKIARNYAVGEALPT